MIWKIISVLRKQAVGLQQAFSGLRMLVAALQQAFSVWRKSAVILQQAFSGSRMSVAALQLVFSELRRITGVISNFASPYFRNRKSSFWNEKYNSSGVFLFGKASSGCGKHVAGVQEAFLTCGKHVAGVQETFLTCGKHVAGVHETFLTCGKLAVGLRLPFHSWECFFRFLFCILMKFSV